MSSFTVLALLLAGGQVACSMETSPALCGAPGAEAECREKGSVLLQVASDSLLQKTRVADTRVAAQAHAQLTEKEAAAARSVAHEQLKQYTELKAALAKSKESADVMRMIDDALDGDHSKKSGARKVPKKNKKLLKAVKKKVAKLAKNPGFSLLETSSGKVASHSKAAAVTKNSDDDNNDEENNDEADADAGNNDEENEASNEEDNTDESEDEEGEDADEGAEDAEEGEADNEEESEEGNANEEEEDNANEEEDSANEEDGEEEEVNANEEDAEEEEDDDDPKGSLSMVSVREVTKANKVSLDEEGYQEVANANNNRGMERFITRVANDMDMEILEVGGLQGMVPFYSGLKSSQSFAALRSELRAVSRETDGWLERRKRHHRHESVLLQTGTAEHGEQQASLSLLGMTATRASRAAHKVPDLAVALFGSRTLVLICTGALVTMLFCLDEKKRTSKAVYEDPLNLDPLPPPAKDDPYAEANLAMLRGPKNAPAI